MKGKGVVRGALVSLAVVGFCLPQTAFAVQASVDRVPSVADVALQDGGVLCGQVVDPQGIPLARVPVSLQDRNGEVARAVTDGNGYFAVQGLRGGVHQLVAARGHGTFRLWTPGTAPPSSQKGALLVAARETVRGQQCESGCEPECGVPCGPCYGSGCKGVAYWLANPWVVTGIVATAVAVPVAIHNSGRPASP